MLNELESIARGVTRARIETDHRHPDVRVAGKKRTLKVQLDEIGRVTAVVLVPAALSPWTLRDGQHNSFPLVQLKKPLWGTPLTDLQRETVADKKNRRQALRQLAGIAHLDAAAYANWPGKKMITRLRERREQLVPLQNGLASVVLATFDRFLRAFDPTAGGDALRTIESVARRVTEDIERIAQDDYLECAVALLVGEKKSDEWQCTTALLFEASGYPTSIVDPRVIEPVSDVLTKADDAHAQTTGICGLTGLKVELLTGNFPQPNLPVLGQTWLFAKNSEIPANDRYGRFANAAMPVGRDTAIRLDAALRVLTEPDRKNKTWRAIPSETAKQSDLLLAFIEAAPDAASAGMLAEEDFSEEEGSKPTDMANSVAAFEKRTERLINTIRATVEADLRETRVQLIVLRKVDRANRKVVYSSMPTVADLEKASRVWLDGERNLPSWLSLPMFVKNERRSRAMPPPHVAPLGLISFSKLLFIRNGMETQEIVGVSAAEALELFLVPAQGGAQSSHRIVRMLRLILTRRAALIVGAADAARWRRNARKEYDNHETLRTLTVLGVLLHKLNRRKETYMNEAAFQMGQLLAAADAVHAGYCADVRRGDLPPSLLGNQVFGMAQTAPAKALATLCRRWRPYDGWTKRVARDQQRIAALATSTDKEDQQRGWDIRKALRQAREMRSLAEKLGPALDGCRADDTFNAELLLGYIAGLPRAQKDDTKGQDEEQVEEQEE